MKLVIAADPRFDAGWFWDDIPFREVKTLWVAWARAVEMILRAAGLEGETARMNYRRVTMPTITPWPGSEPTDPLTVESAIWRYAHSALDFNDRSGWRANFLRAWRVGLDLRARLERTREGRDLLDRLTREERDGNNETRSKR